MVFSRGISAIGVDVSVIFNLPGRFPEVKATGMQNRGHSDSCGLLRTQRRGVPPRRNKVRARTADANMRKRLPGFDAGGAPSRLRPYIITVSGVSAPTNIRVVLKSANDMRKEMAADPRSAGRRKGNRMGRNTAALEAARLK